LIEYLARSVVLNVAEHVKTEKAKGNLRIYLQDTACKTSKTDRSHSSCTVELQQDILLLLLLQVYNNKLNKQGEVGHELFSNWPMLPTRRRKEERPST